MTDNPEWKEIHDTLLHGEWEEWKEIPGTAVKDGESRVITLEGPACPFCKKKFHLKASGVGNDPRIFMVPIDRCLDRLLAELREKTERIEALEHELSEYEDRPGIGG